MDKEARRRSELRPNGVTNAPCRGCDYLPPCGGIETARGLFNCFDEGCCTKGTCDFVCPNKADYPARMREIHGLRFDDLAALCQPTVALPPYVPVIDHSSARHQCLEWPVVALNTYRVLSKRRNSYRPVAEDADQLRVKFGLGSSTAIILRGVSRDPPLEIYWENRAVEQAPERLARLGIMMVIGPNFSHFLGVPRTDNLFNRKRQLICIEELAAAGMCAVPHVSAVVPGDWRFWGWYLQRNPQVTYVAKEFQTGNRSPKQGRKVIRELARLQDAAGRRLHPLLIGGGQFAADAAACFNQFTMIDSTPFMKTMHRQIFDLGAGKWPWRESFSLERQGLDRMLADNVAGYSAWIESRWESAGRTGPTLTRDAECNDHEETETASAAQSADFSRSARRIRGFELRPQAVDSPGVDVSEGPRCLTV